MSSNELTETQLGEIKTAFQMFDKNGDGNIEITELAEIVTKVLGARPDPANLQKLFVQLDKDKNGTIDQEEFVEAMKGWLAVDDVANVGRKRNRDLHLSMDEERERVHKKIRSFFTQFTKEAYADLVREYKREMRRRGAGSFGNNEVSDMITSDGIDGGEVSSELKLKTLKMSLDIMGQFNELLLHINSGIAANQLQGAKAVASMLSIVEVFSSPSQRAIISDDLVKIYGTVYQSGVHKRLLEFMQVSLVANPELQYHATRAITFFAPGPRTASLTEESFFYPPKMHCKIMLFEAGVVPTLCNLLGSAAADAVKEQAVMAIGSLASHHAKCRNFIIEHNNGVIFSMLTPLISVNAPIKVLRKLTWAFSILCGATCPPDELPPFDKIRAGLQAIGWLFVNCNDAYIIQNCCKVLELTLPNQTEPAFCRKLAELLTRADVFDASLDVIHALFARDTVQTKMLLEAGVLDKLITVLKSKSDEVSNDIRLRICDAVSTLVRMGHRLDAVVLSNSKVIPTILQMILQEEGDLRRKLVRTLVTIVMASTNRELLKYYVECGVVKMLGQCFAHVKRYDDVLTTVYKHTDAMYDFELVHGILMGLYFILSSGWVASGDNTFGEAFDRNLLDKLETLCDAVYGSSATEANTTKWKTACFDNTFTCEHFAELLLHDISKYCAAAGETNAKAKGVLALIAALKRKYPHIGLRISSGKVLLIKFKYGSECRLLDVDAATPYADFIAILTARLGFQPAVQYQDREGDMVLVDGPISLKAAFDSVQATGRNTFHVVPSTAPADLPGDAIEFHFAMPGFSNDLAQFSVDGEAEIGNQRMKPYLLQELGKRSHFSYDELAQLQQFWQKKSHDGEFLTKEEFVAGLKTFMGITDPLVLDQNFSAFKYSRNKRDVFTADMISFNEFVVGLSTLLRGESEESLRFVFNAYDTDGSGYLSHDEIENIFKASMRWTGRPMPEEQLRAMTQKLMTEIDTNNDNQISFDEFKQAIASNKLLIKFYKAAK